MPLFRYSLAFGPSSKVVELRRSNPQGWLYKAVEEAFPEIGQRRRQDLLRLRLMRIDQREAWRATMSDGPNDLLIEVTKISK